MQSNHRIDETSTSQSSSSVSRNSVSSEPLESPLTRTATVVLIVISLVVLQLQSVSRSEIVADFVYTGYMKNLPSIKNRSDYWTTTYKGPIQHQEQQLVDFVRGEHQSDDDAIQKTFTKEDEPKSVLDEGAVVLQTEPIDETKHQVGPYNRTRAEENDPLLNILPATYRTKPNIPTWMKEYFDWHRIQTAGMSESDWNATITKDRAITKPVSNQTTAKNWNHRKFLVVDCVGKQRCGGLSDRIKPLLAFVAIAAHQPTGLNGTHQKRILMVRWTDRPYPLEEFLLPNEVNWTVPEYMAKTLDKYENRRVMRQVYDIRNLRHGKSEGLFELTHEETTVVLTRKQVHDGGSTMFECIMETFYGTIGKPGQFKWDNLCHSVQDRDDDGSSYRRIYHDFFRTMFRPSEPVRALMESKLRAANLQPGGFVGAHYRADYGKQKERGGLKAIQQKASTIVWCAAMVAGSSPVYFAGDTSTALDQVEVEARGHLAKKGITVMTPVMAEKKVAAASAGDNVSVTITPYTTSNTTTTKKPFHIETDKGPVEDFYPAFVDLLVMAESRCQFYGRGGFGKFASLLSYNASCYFNFRGCDTETIPVDLPHKCCNV